MAHLVSIALKPEDLERRPLGRFSRRSVERAELVAGRGLAGDLKARAGKRQLNVLLAEAIAELRAEGFHTEPGELGEQLVVAGLAAGDARPGARLKIGQAVIELGELRTPCARLVEVQGQPTGAVRQRIGFMAKVLVGGEIAVGDLVSIEAPSPVTRTAR